MSELTRYDIKTDMPVPVTKEWVSCIQRATDKLGFCREIVQLLHDPEIFTKLTNGDLLEIGDLIRNKYEKIEGEQGG